MCQKYVVEAGRQGSLGNSANMFSVGPELGDRREAVWHMGCSFLRLLFKAKNYPPGRAGDGFEAM